MFLLRVLSTMGLVAMVWISLELIDVRRSVCRWPEGECGRQADEYAPSK
jgi:hypothetical protein